MRKNNKLYIILMLVVSVITAGIAFSRYTSLIEIGAMSKTTPDSKNFDYLISVDKPKTEHTIDMDIFLPATTFLYNDTAESFSSVVDKRVLTFENKNNDSTKMRVDITPSNLNDIGVLWCVISGTVADGAEQSVIKAALAPYGYSNYATLKNRLTEINPKSFEVDPTLNSKLTIIFWAEDDMAKVNLSAENIKQRISFGITVSEVTVP